MASQYCGGKKEKREVPTMCGLHRFELGLPERSFPYASNRLIGGCDGGTSSDEFLGRLPGISPDIARPRRSGKDSSCHSHWKLPLQSDAIWLEERWIYILKDVRTTVGQKH